MLQIPIKMVALYALMFLGGSFSLVLYLLYRYPWLKYDFAFLRTSLPQVIFTKKCSKKSILVCDMFENNVKKHPEKTFIVFEGQKYSFDYVNKKANKVGNLARKLGWKCGDLVALLIYNEPAFIWTYLGLMKIGVKMALLNFNLRSKSLQHCVEVNKHLKAIIIGQGDDLRDAIAEIYLELEDKPEVYVQGSSDHLPYEHFIMFDDLMDEAAEYPVRESLRYGIGAKDTNCLIYTSGTTGLPKAAIVTHLKSVKATTLMNLSHITEDDVIYTPLPLYHSAAGLIALGACVKNGCTLVLRNKFSASKFWSDCRENNVTVVQYIGELCRYLLAQPKSDLDKDHRVWLAFGNGLRKDIFEEFQTRFGLKKIGEFYAATEGNSGFINIFNKPGCIGRLSPLLSALTSTYLIKYDYVQDEPVKDQRGKYVMAKPGEKGLCISKVRPLQEYDGYEGNRQLSEKKMLCNVFKKGDRYYNTGDVLNFDEEYFLYFSDRIGDTFRWKGENVSTIEVGNVMTNLDFIEDANVYGVEIPGHDGKCGMVSLNLANQRAVITPEELQCLYKHCTDLLPFYAKPRFVRVEKQAIVTATFKQQKFALVKQGFNPDVCGDVQLFYMSAKDNTYSPLDAAAYQLIIDGQIRM